MLTQGSLAGFKAQIIDTTARLWSATAFPKKVLILLIIICLSLLLMSLFLCLLLLATAEFMILFKECRYHCYDLFVFIGVVAVVDVFVVVVYYYYLLISASSSLLLLLLLLLL
jgi:hypothetical protein